MSDNKNIVRDRTLILRVLVPGLHTSLNDKINSKKDNDSGVASQSAAAVSSSSFLPTPMLNRRPLHAGGSNAITEDQLLNLDGVTCLPSKSGSTLWNFRLVWRCML